MKDNYNLYKNYIKNINIIDEIMFYKYIHLDVNGNDISHIKMFEVGNILKKIIKSKQLNEKEKEAFNKQMAKILLFVYHKGTKEYQNIYNNIINEVIKVKTIQR
jgi:hypothetical protein